jgi:hypothetical protein
MSTCVVAVRDANNVPVADATVTLDDVTNSGGTTVFVIQNKPTHTLTVEAPDYVTETARFNGTLDLGEWDNALLSRSVDQGRIALTMRLGRLDVAPTVTIPKDGIKKLADARADAQAVLLDTLPRSPFGAWPVYRSHFLDPYAVWLTSTTLLPPPPPLVGAQGWARFTGGPADPKADPMESGRFFWLQHRNSSSSTFAVAVWSRNINHEGPLEALDMFVFFSPTTAAYKAKYPFGVIPGEKQGSDPDQQYMSLGSKYLLEQYGFAYELIARKRQAVLVMPICRHGDWGPYVTGEGMFRLCREVALFLHRECRTSNKALLSSAGVPHELWHAGGTLRSPSVSGIYGTDFGAPPRPGRIAVGGFSSGILPVKQLMATWGLPRGYTQRLSGCPYVALAGADTKEPRDLWADAWRELWDMDGYHRETGGWPNYLNLIRTWAFTNDVARTRMVRMCHSLGQPDPKTDPHPTWKAMMAEPPGVTVDNYGIQFARELQGGRWSVVHLDGKFIDLGFGPPELGPDVHHAIPKIAFSYFSALSPIGMPH